MLQNEVSFIIHKNAQKQSINFSENANRKTIPQVVQYS